MTGLTGDPYLDAIVPPGAFLTVGELVTANAKAGGYWFSDDTRRWFDPKLQLLYGGCYLVANEKDYDGSRVWRLARADHTGRVDYLPAPEWATYASLAFADYADAQRAALALEAGRPAVDQLDYNAHVLCSDSANTAQHYASWGVSGTPYCHQHAGNILAASLDTSAGVKRKGGIHRGDPLGGDRGGATFDPAIDTLRLNKQMRAVYSVVRDGDWHTLRAVANDTGSPEASVSARLRDFRKRQFGGHTVERKRVDFAGGTWVYRLVWNEAVPRPDLRGS